MLNREGRKNKCHTDLGHNSRARLDANSLTLIFCSRTEDERQNYASLFLTVIKHWTSHETPGHRLMCVLYRLTGRASFGRILGWTQPTFETFFVMTIGSTLNTRQARLAGLNLKRPWINVHYNENNVFSILLPFLFKVYCCYTALVSNLKTLVRRVKDGIIIWTLCVCGQSAATQSICVKFPCDQCEYTTT